MSGSNLHMAWSRLFLRALAASGVTRVVISPGSRSTPLALAAADEAGVTTHVVVDERSAAFVALGHARITGRPSVLLCTSGTAGAHYLPAVMEASLAHIPLVVVTADRPWEAQDCGAPQTVDQTGLFGTHVRHHAELGLPDASPAVLRTVARVAAQAVHRALGPTPGAVHINVRYRKPLEPVDIHGPEPWEPDVAALLARGAPRVYAPDAQPDGAAVQSLAEACRASARGLIVCGPMAATGADAGLRAAVAALARSTGYPVLPEATSQVRLGPELTSLPVCAGFDTVLRDPTFCREHPPQVVIALGAPPTSMAWAQYMDQHPEARRYVVARHGWADPAGDATALVMADPAAVCAAVAARLGDTPPRAETRAWAADFTDADRRSWVCVQKETAGGALTEGTVAARVVGAVPAGGVLMVGNSMPVRDLDTYVPAGGPAVRVLHQRGASGIDGLVSGAVGAQQASGAPVALLLGDVSMQHDLGGLASARGLTGPLCVVVVQNNGGRIFQQLPLARRREVGATFERLFITPQDLDFSHAAALFGLGYARVTSVADLDAALARGISMPGCTVVEAVVPPMDATARRAALYRDVQGARR